jgi:hypothetical protein
MTTEFRTQFFSDLPYHQISQPSRKSNKYIKWFGAYIAIPLISLILLASLVLLFLLAKFYFSNSHLFDNQNQLSQSKNLNIDALMNNKFEQYNAIKSEKEQNQDLNKETKTSSLVRLLKNKKEFDNVIIDDEATVERAQLKLIQKSIDNLHLNKNNDEINLKNGIVRND